MHPLCDMTNKTILVTGASSGIGRETAIQLSLLGGRIILVGRDEVKLQETQQLLQDQSNHIIAPFDLLQTDTISAWLKEVTLKTGPLDGLAHCAGIHQVKPLKLIEPKDYQSIFEVNVGSAFNLSRAFLQRNVAARPSSIVFVSSVAGLQGQAGISAYAASKGALVAITKSLAMEFAQEKIRVNCVAPGVVMTAMTEKLFGKMSEEQVNAVKAMHPLGLGAPKDVAMGIAFLLSDAARWMTGTSLIMDGGYCAH